MKSLKWLLIALIAGATPAFADTDLSKDFDALGGNSKLIERAKALSAGQRVRIVQRRAVDRSLRLEVGAHMGTMAGGSSYMESNQFGGYLDFHITPKVALGVRYYNFSNGFTDDAEAQIKAAKSNNSVNNPYRIPALDFPEDSTVATISWFPFYGKMNLFDRAIAQFDVYLLGGGGQINLESGSTETYTAGGGVGMWLAQHLSARLELRWQRYEDNPITGNPQTRDLTLANAALGILF